MQAEDIRRWQVRQPFQPFRLSLTDGRTFDVRHPELILVSKRYVAVGLPDDPQGEPSVPERIAEIDVFHIISCEPLTPTAPAGNGQGAQPQSNP
jgi:hypothetical protein